MVLKICSTRQSPYLRRCFEIRCLWPMD